MLEQLSRHSLMDLTVRAEGDTHIDLHHTTEDVGIAIGQAISKALGDRKGITRYASIDLPMDEVCTRAAVDVSGRPHLVWKVKFERPKVGEFDTELFKEFFQALALRIPASRLHVVNPLRREQPPHRRNVLQGGGAGLQTPLAIDPRNAERDTLHQGHLERLEIFHA